MHPLVLFFLHLLRKVQILSQAKWNNWNVFLVTWVFWIQDKKKGVINYRSTNDIFSFWRHLEGNDQQLWKNWIDWKKKNLEIKKRPTKKRFGPTLGNISTFFNSNVAWNKNDPQQMFLKMILCCWLLKRLCHWQMLNHQFLED